jgi:hypothetical protein
MISIGFTMVSSLVVGWKSCGKTRQFSPIVSARIVDHKSVMKRPAVERNDSLTETASLGTLGYPTAHNAAIVNQCGFSGSDLNSIYARKGS